MSIIINDFLEKLKQGGYNMRTLSNDLDIPYARIVGWRRGEGRPKAEDQKKIEEYLGVPKYVPPTPSERIEELRRINDLLEKGISLSLNSVLESQERLKRDHDLMLHILQRYGERLEDIHHHVIPPPANDKGGGRRRKEGDGGLN